MRVGVPTEIKVHEYRVGLTPSAVREYVAHGHKVVVQSGAGLGIMASDEAYKKAELQISDSALQMGIIDQTKQNADKILKPMFEKISGKKIKLFYDFQ